MNDYLALVITVCDTLKGDPSSPGVLVSFLPDGRWYLSIQRYTKAYGEGKVIICKTTGPTFDKALRNLCILWKNYLESLKVEALLSLPEGK